MKLAFVLLCVVMPCTECYVGGSPPLCDEDYYNDFMDGLDNDMNSSGTCMRHCGEAGCIELNTKPAPKGMNPSMVTKDRMHLCHDSPDRQFCSPPATDVNDWFDDVHLNIVFTRASVCEKDNKRYICDITSYKPATEAVQSSSYKDYDVYCDDNDEVTNATAEPVLDCCNSDASLLSGSSFDDDFACKVVKSKTLEDKDDFSGQRKLINEKFLVLFWIFALTALVGNVTVISYNIWRLKQNRSRLSKVERLHSIMVLNLSTADILMGLYLFILAVAASQGRVTLHKRRVWMQSATCTGIAIVNFVSNQTSVTALVIITVLRTFSVLRPYKIIKLKLVVGLMLFSWIFWLAVAFIPVLKLDSIKFLFTSFTEVGAKNEGKRPLFEYDDLHHFADIILSGINRHCGFNSSDQRYVLPSYCDWDCLLAVTGKLDLVKSEDVHFYGYYNTQVVCTMRYLTTNREKSMFFTLFILCFNILSFLAIFASQLVICRKVSIGTDILTSLNCCRNGVISKEPGATLPPHLQRREEENHKMHRRMFFIVATDFCCWIPICVISLYFIIKGSSLASCEFHQFHKDFRAWFSILLVVMIPLNSAVNPFLYSLNFWETLRRKFFLRSGEKREGAKEAYSLTTLAKSSTSVAITSAIITANVSASSNAL